MKILKKIFINFSSNNFFVLIFLLILIFLSCHSLFNSFFESDEWTYLTYYLPLTKNPLGYWSIVFSFFTQSGSIFGEHFDPISASINFLNVKLFGINFVPYAFMSLLLHALNSFLVFILIKTLLINIKRS